MIGLTFGLKIVMSATINAAIHEPYIKVLGTCPAKIDSMLYDIAKDPTTSVIATNKIDFVVVPAIVAACSKPPKLI